MHRLKVSDYAAWERRRAYRTAVTAIRRHVNPELQRACFLHYLSLRFNMEQEAITFRDIRRELVDRGWNPPDAALALLEDMLRGSDLSRFGRGHEDPVP